MKKTIILMAVLAYCLVANAQSPQRTWQNCYDAVANNGYAGAYLNFIDHGYVYLQGYATAGGGDVWGYYGGGDAWFLRLDSNGDIVRSRCFGGTDNDNFYYMKSKVTGNLIITGDTRSTNGDLSTTVANGGSDIVVAAMDTAFNLLWIKRYGTASDDGTYGEPIPFEDSRGNIYINAYTDDLTSPLFGLYGGRFNQTRHVIARFDSRGNLLPFVTGKIDSSCYRVSGRYHNMNERNLVGIDDQDNFYLTLKGRGIIVLDSNFNYLRHKAIDINRTYGVRSTFPNGDLLVIGYKSVTQQHIHTSASIIDKNMNTKWVITDTAIINTMYKYNSTIDRKGNYRLGNIIIDTAGNVVAKTNKWINTPVLQYGPNDWDVYAHVAEVNGKIFLKGDASKINGQCDTLHKNTNPLSKFYTHGVSVEEVKPTATYTLKALPHNQYAIEMGQASSFSYTVYDLLGHVLAHKDLQQATTASIDLQPYANGIYILHIPGYATKKLVRIE